MKCQFISKSCWTLNACEKLRLQGYFWTIFVRCMICENELLTCIAHKGKVYKYTHVSNVSYVSKVFTLKKIFLYLEKFFCFFTDFSTYESVIRYFYMWDKLLCNCGNAMTFHFILVFSIVSIAFIYFHYIESIFVRGIQLCIPFIRSR